MTKNTSIIIIGFGSIGQRHYRNLSKLGYKNISVFDIDRKKIGSQVKSIKNLSIKTLEQFEVAFICNPNNSHIKTALQCAKAGCHIFIEKPLSHNFDNINQLQKIVNKKQLVNMVACNMRFNPGLKFVKNYLDNEKLGKIYAIHHEFGYYLPDWRPGQDYRKNYAAKRKTGGGIILDDIHEFDLLFWLNNFKKVLESKLIFNKVSNLKIETEDACIGAFKFSNKVLGSVRCDYLQQNQSRNLKIIGEKGNLEWDYKNDVVYLKTKQGSKKLFELKRANDNDDYIAEIKYFLGAVKRRRKTFNNIETATQVLNYCLKR